jgi:Domain of unknown function (DUF5107)
MSQPVTIENDAIRMEVWPTIGGKVASVIDKADKYELMFNYASELPTVALYDVPFDRSWYAGWDECFPSIGPSQYVGHPYDGIAVPDHGELWGLPTTAVPTKDGITTVWHGLRFGYRLTRKLHLDGPSLIAEYTLINLAPFEFRFVWALHSLMAMIQPVHFGLPSAKFQFSHDAQSVEQQQPFEWPIVSEMVDLSKTETLPARKGWKVFSTEPINGPFVVRYPTRGRSVSIEYTSESNLPAYWGIWINTGGWSGHKHFAIEPTTGRYDQIDRSIWDGSAGRIAPMGRCDWTVRWTLS